MANAYHLRNGKAANAFRVPTRSVMAGVKAPVRPDHKLGKGMAGIVVTDRVRGLADADRRHAMRRASI